MSRIARSGADVVGEQPVEHIGGDAHLHGVEAAPALVALQHVERADVLAEAVGLDDRFGKRRGILEAEIEALPGDRVDAVRGVAGQREARRDEGARQRQAERPGARLVLDADLAELQAEALLELGLEQERIAGDQFFGVGRALGPDDRRAVAGQRQDGERPGRQEMLLGAAIVRPLMRDRADDAGLAVLPADGLDAGHVAQPRLDAVGGDQQRGLQRHAVGQMHRRGAPARSKTPRRRRPR